MEQMGLNMTERKNAQFIAELSEQLEKEMMSKYGPLMFGQVLYQALGFNSVDAFRQASKRDKLPIKVFSLENKRGKYALTKDVAYWLAEKRLSIEEKK
ncbi:MAG: hypothetical protein ACJAS1_005578 [Oleiphilaceae bacterium]|jgi:hypothetical protein